MSGSEDAASATSHDVQASDVETSLANLRIECETAWAQVKETQKQLMPVQQTDFTAEASGQQPLITILREKERQLRAEIEVTKNLAPQTLPNDSLVRKTHCWLSDWTFELTHGYE